MYLIYVSWLWLSGRLLLLQEISCCALRCAVAIGAFGAICKASPFNVICCRVCRSRSCSTACVLHGPWLFCGRPETRSWNSWPSRFPAVSWLWLRFQTKKVNRFRYVFRKCFVFLESQNRPGLLYEVCDCIVVRFVDGGVVGWYKEVITRKLGERGPLCHSYCCMINMNAIVLASLSGLVRL